MTQRRRILVVEDERAIADAVAARLRAEEFAVEVAVDGPAAVATARGSRSRTAASGGCQPAGQRGPAQPTGGYRHRRRRREAAGSG